MRPLEEYQREAHARLAWAVQGIGDVGAVWSAADVTPITPPEYKEMARRLRLAAGHLTMLAELCLYLAAEEPE